MRMQTARRVRLCALLVTFVAQAATAADAPRFEFTPFAGGRLGGSFDVREPDSEETSAVDIDAAASWGADLALVARNNGFYNLMYSTQRAGLDSSDPGLAGVDLRIDYLQIGGTALFPQDQWYVPYLSLTIGATFLEPTSGGYDSETRFSGSVGGGFRFPVNERLNVILGLRGYLTFLDSDSELFCISAPPQGACLFQSSGSTLFQGEAQLGISFAF